MTRLGVLGGGQLGRMLALAGYPLDLSFLFLEKTEGSPAGALAPTLVAAYDDPEALDRLAAAVDVATYEFENVPVGSVRRVGERIPVFPPPNALECAQDRLREKEACRALGIPTAPFAVVDGRGDLEAALASIGVPSILKTRREGYDGKGQAPIRSAAEAGVALDSLGGRPLILEGFVPFERELSILAVRGRDGAVAFWPLVENRHREGILRLSLAPAEGVADGLQRLAEDHARKLLEALEYVGVLAIEFFHRRGELLVNEMAPRVHNSGHWTIEGATTSQFENHLRAVVGLPLGATEAVGASAMVNLIGEVPDVAAMAAIPGAHLHLYGKSARPGRKLGHVTIVARDASSRAAALRRLAKLVPDASLER